MSVSMPWRRTPTRLSRKLMAFFVNISHVDDIPALTKLSFDRIQNMKANMWGDRVNIVFSDMRTWKAPEKADILVSELLGSFGDNELSPECLDGAQKFLKPDGISIPANYTTFVAPMASNKLHSDVAAFKDLTHFETSYVVMFKAISLLAQPKPIWVFEHPNRAEIPMDQGKWVSIGKLEYLV